MKIKNKGRIKRILFITLSNIGDIILTTPVLAVLRREFPNANIDVLSGPNGHDIFFGHPFVSNFISYDKFSNLHHKRHLIKDLRKNRYDLIIDLRNSLFPLLIGSRYRSSIIRSVPSRIKHKKDRHLWKLKALGLNVENAPFSFYVDNRDRAFIDNLLAGLNAKKDFVVVSPGAKSHIKRWAKEGFAAVCDRLISEAKVGVIMAGDAEDRKIIYDINALMKNKAFDLSAKLTLRQLGALIERSRLLITNDSAPMHVGHALGARVLAIFGPTDPRKYSPRGKHDVVVNKELSCLPCEAAQCMKNHECMNLITSDEVFEAAGRILTAK